MGLFRVYCKFSTRAVQFIAFRSKNQNDPRSEMQRTAFSPLKISSLIERRRLMIIFFVCVTLKNKSVEVETNIELREHTSHIMHFLSNV